MRSASATGYLSRLIDWQTLSRSQFTSRTSSLGLALGNGLVVGELPRLALDESTAHIVGHQQRCALGGGICGDRSPRLGVEGIRDLLCPVSRVELRHLVAVKSVKW